jgi:tetratricopeptide (TPR) repeat protein
MAPRVRERNKLKANTGTVVGTVVKTDKWIPAGLLLLALVAHLPALWSGLIWDDQIILRDQLVRFDSLRDVLLPPAGIPNWSETYYRPLITLSYLLDFGLVDESAGARVAHISNLAFHAGSVLLLWLLARRVLQTATPWPAAVAAALFAVHPVHVESVNWISGRTDVLATLFSLAAAVAALRWRDCRAWTALVATGLCLLLALMAKETAIAMLVLIPALWWLVPRPQAGKSAQPLMDWPFWLYGASALCVPLLAYVVMRLVSGTVVGQPLDVPVVVMLLGLLRVVSWYLLTLLMPWPPHNLVTWDMLPGPLIAGPIVLAAGAVAFLAARNWRRGGDAAPLLALLWIAVALAPSLWIALSAGTRTPVAERYLYLPSVGFSLGIGWLVALTGLRFVRGAAAAAIAAGVAGAFTWGLAWSSDVRLWTYTTTRSPHADFAWHSLARAWRAAGDIGQARAAYQRGIEAGRSAFDRSKLLYGLAEIDLVEGNLDAAESRMQQSRREFPQFVRAGFGIGLVALLRAGESTEAPAMQARAEAMGEFRESLRVTPDFHEARIALAQALAAQGDALSALGRSEEARATWREALHELDVLDVTLPRPQLIAYLRDAEPGLERDPDRLRRRIMAALI